MSQSEGSRRGASTQEAPFDIKGLTHEALMHLQFKTARTHFVRWAERMTCRDVQEGLRTGGGSDAKAMFTLQP